MSKSSKKYVLLGLLILCVLINFIMPAIPQDLSYHGFVDTRNFLSISNFMDVISNLPFIFVGVIGMIKTIHSQHKLKLHYALFFFGIFLVGFGSGYYHLMPNNETLIWDRIPMAIGFASLFSAIISEKIDFKIGTILLPILLVFGVGSVIYWGYTDDLRLYILTQFLPIMAIPIILIMTPSKNNIYLWEMVGLYIFAKLLEHFDEWVFFTSMHTISGHTVKHIVASIAVYQVVRYLKNEEINE